MIGEIVNHTDHEVDVLVTVRGDNLEGSEKLLGANVPVSLLSDLLDWDIDGGWFVRSVAFGDAVLLGKWLSSEKEFGAWYLENGINMSLDLLVAPGEDWSDGQVLEVSCGSSLLHHVKDSSLNPVVVSEYNRSARALLS